MRATPRNCSARSAVRVICFARRNLTAMSSSLRMRLTLWYSGAFSVVLILFSTGVYFFVERLLRDRVDTNLRLTLQMTSSALNRHTAAHTSLSAPDSKGQVTGSSITEALEDSRFPSQIIAILEADGRMLAGRPATSALALRLPVLPLRASLSPQF